MHPLTPKDQEQPEIFVIPAGGKHRAPEVWHSDVTWRPEPSLGSVLRAVELPPIGGDTLWADMGAAYDLLDDATKERIDDLVGLHDFTRAFGWNQPPEVQEKMRAKHPTQEHPVVRTHPETGRKTIYVNGGFTMGIKGMDDAASRRRCSTGCSARRRSPTCSAGSGGRRAASRSGTTAPPSTW